MPQEGEEGVWFTAAGLLKHLCQGHLPLIQQPLGDRDVPMAQLVLQGDTGGGGGGGGGDRQQRSSCCATCWGMVQVLQEALGGPGVANCCASLRLAFQDL